MSLFHSQAGPAQAPAQHPNSTPTPGQCYAHSYQQSDAHSHPECSLPRGLSPPFAPTTPAPVLAPNPAPNARPHSLGIDPPNNPNPALPPCAHSHPRSLAQTPTPRSFAATPRPPPVSITPTLRHPSNTPSISALLSGSAAGKDLELQEKRDSDRRTGRTDCLAMRPSGCGATGGEGGRDRWGNRWGIENHVLSPVISERTEPTHTSISSPTSSMATCLSLCSVASRARPRTRPAPVPPPSSHSHSTSRPSSAVPIPGRYPPSETTISLHSTRTRTDSLPPPVRLSDHPACSPTDPGRAGPTPAPLARAEQRLSRRRAKEDDTRRRDLEFAARQAAKRAEKERRDQMVCKRDEIVKKLIESPTDAKLVRDLGKLYLQNNESISRPSGTAAATGAKPGTSRRGSEPSLKLAIHYLEQSIQLNNRDAQTWLYLGRAWALLQAYPALHPAEREQRLSNASLGYRKSITLAAVGGQLRQANSYRLAFAEYLEGLARHEEAAGVLQEALSETEEVECWWELGRMMELWALEEGVEMADRVARMGHACEAYKRATEMEPGDEMMRGGRADGEKLLEKLRAQLRADQARPDQARLTHADGAHRPASVTGTERHAGGASAAELKRLVAEMATIPEFGQKVERVASSHQPAGNVASSANGLASHVEANRASVASAAHAETYSLATSTPQAPGHPSANSTHQVQVDQPAVESMAHCETYSADAVAPQIESELSAAASRAHRETHLSHPSNAHVQPDPLPLSAHPDPNQSEPVTPPLQSDLSAMVSLAPREACHSDDGMANGQIYSPSDSTQHLAMTSPAASTPQLPAYSSTASTPHLTYSSTSSTPHLQTNPSVVPTPHLEMHPPAAPPLHYQKYPSTASTPHLTYSSTVSTPHLNTNSSTAPTTRPETEERMVKSSVTLMSEGASSGAPSPNCRAKSESKASKMAELSPTSWPDHVQSSPAGPPEILKAPEAFQFSPPGCRLSIQHAGQRLQRLARTTTPCGSPGIEGLQSPPLVDSGPCLSSYRPPSPSALPTPTMQSLGGRLGTPKQLPGSPSSSASSGRQAGKKLKGHRQTDGHGGRPGHGPSLSLGKLGYQGQFADCCQQQWASANVRSSEPSGQYNQGSSIDGLNGPKMEVKAKQDRGSGSADGPLASVVGREEWGGALDHHRHGEQQGRGARASTRVNGRVEFKASASHHQSVNVKNQTGKARSTRLGAEQDRRADLLGPPPVIPPRPVSCLTTPVGAAVEPGRPASRMAEARPGSRSGAGSGHHRTTQVPMARAETARPYEGSGPNSERTASYNYSLIDAHLQSIVEIDSRRRSELKELRRQFDRTDEWAERRRTEVVDELRRLCGSVGGGRRRKGSGSGGALAGGGLQRCNSSQQAPEGAGHNGRMSVGGNAMVGLESAGYALNGIASIIQLVQQQQQHQQQQEGQGDVMSSGPTGGVQAKQMGAGDQFDIQESGLGRPVSSAGMTGVGGGAGGPKVHYHHQQQTQPQTHQQQVQLQAGLVDPMRLMMTTTTTTTSTDF